MSFDPTEQVYEDEATGWQAGLYTDIRETLRAPIVNSIWRTQLYHAPDVLRYVWGQLKPVFETRAFAEFSVAYRDTLLSAVDDGLPSYDPAAVGLEPAAFTELRGQLATFDAVSPRLAVLFVLMDRRLHGEPVGSEFEGSRAATAPFPDWLDADRGRPPTMLPQDRARERLPEALTGDFGDMVPSIYRCLAQWPAYLEQSWSDLEPVLDSEAYGRARKEAFELVEQHLDRLAHEPAVDPETLERRGVDRETVEGLQGLFGTFRAGGETVLPHLCLHATAVGAEGERAGLAGP